MNKQLYDLKIIFKNGKKIELSDVEEYCFAKQHLFIKRIDDCITFKRDMLSEAYRKLSFLTNFKKILIPHK